MVTIVRQPLRNRSIGCKTLLGGQGEVFFEALANSKFIQPSMTLDYSGALVLTVGNIPEATISQIFRLRPNGLQNLLTGEDQSLHFMPPDGDRRKRELELSIEDREEEVGQLELDLDKGSKDNAASIDKLQKELNATADQFPDQLPLRTEDEQKLKAKINKIEDQINDTHQKILAHGDVSERARSELEVLSQKAASCKCKGSSNSKKVSFLQTEGRQPRHLSEEQIAAMVNDLPSLTLDVATQTDVSAVEGAPEDESVAIEALVRKAEELERQREDLQAQLQQDARRFREARSKLLDQSKVASRELYAAKIQAVREEEAAKKRERMLGKQETYATTMLKQQAAKLENLSKQIADYGTRIKQLSDFLKTCGCAAKDALVWMPPANLSTATTNECSASLELGASAPVLRKRAEKYRKLGQLQKAIADFNTSLELEPSASAFAGRGAAYRSLGRLKEAGIDFNAAIHLEPFNVQVWMGRAHVFREQGRFVEAIFVGLRVGM
eukprot:symbB.v1.2.008089.t1/scaffold503.1/size194688/4